MENAVLSISSLAKSYGHEKALENISFQVKKGEIFGFLGPNGAGKTTTIRCIMDFIRPDKGWIKVLGQDSHQQATPLKTAIGYMPSDGQLIDRWNSVEHLRFYRSIRQNSNKNINQLVRALDLNPRTLVKQLSSGNRQKLGFILSLVGNPELLILDEPTKGLDPMAQNTFYEILRSYTHQGGTVLLSSHNLSEVERVCSNVAIIRKGRIVADMSMQDIRAMKTHIITATFNNPDYAAHELSQVNNGTINRLGEQHAKRSGFNFSSQCESGQTDYEYDN